MQRAWKTLGGRYGEVTLVRDLRSDAAWFLRFEVGLPGHTDHRATMLLSEAWRPEGRGWAMRSYWYEYLVEPRGSGRRAHHFHEGVLHAHCEDPFPAHPHYRDVEVDLLEAAEEFAAYFARDLLTCAGLFPL